MTTAKEGECHDRKGGHPGAGAHEAVQHRQSHSRSGLRHQGAERKSGTGKGVTKIPPEGEVT